jgi:(p)ppGpp synthase/HD superfamily hydrolase
VNIVDRAQAFAFTYHFGHKNKHDDEPYVLHLQRVAVACREDGLDLVDQAIAWLHDSVEDTAATFETITAAFPDEPEIATAVWHLTKVDGMPNEDYYKRMLGNERAKRVKLRDLHDNFGRNHMIADDITRLRMAKKYSLGIHILTGA